MSNRSTKKAFTLIEMLIAMALISLIVTMVYGSYAATSRSLEVYNGRMACWERGHLALRLMARQLRCAYVPPSQATSAQAAADPNGRRTAQPAVFRAEPFEPGGEILDFTTTNGLGDSTSLSHIKYRFARSEGVLYIRYRPFARRSADSHDPENWLPLVREITDLELTFYDGRQWQPAWDSREAKRLPQTARIAFTVTDDSGREHSCRMTVPIVCHAMARQRVNSKSTGQP